MTMMALLGQTSIVSERRLMTSLTVKRPSGTNVARSISIVRGIEIPNFFMLGPWREGKRTPFCLWGEDGTWCEDKDSIAATVVGYFEKIYTISSPSGIDEVTNAIPKRVTNEMNAKLTRSFTRKEILKAFHQMHLTKAPRLNGMSTIFYHKY